MQTFEDRKTSLDVLSSRVLNVADDFPDVPHSLLGDMAPSLAPMHHRRAASCSIPQRSSADESIMMQVRVSPSSRCVCPDCWLDSSCLGFLQSLIRIFQEGLVRTVTCFFK